MAVNQLRMHVEELGQDVEVKCRVWLGLKLEVPPGRYEVSGSTIAISYPTSLPSPSPVKAQNGNIVLFEVDFVYPVISEDIDSRLKDSLNGRLREEAYDIISKFLTSIKLVAAGTVWANNARQIGGVDMLWLNSFVDGVLTDSAGGLGVVILAKADPFAQIYRTQSEQYRSIRFALAIRLLRCVELMDFSFHTEAFLVAFAVLDDAVQDVIRDLLRKRGDSDAAADKVLSGIRVSRLRRMLDSTLGQIADFRLSSAWPQAFDALSWLNTVRNEVAHSGRSATRSEAAAALYVVERILTALIDNSCLDAEIPPNFQRDIHYACASARPRQAWFPDIFEVQETMKIVFP